MALPFLKDKKVAAVIVKQRDGASGGFHEQNEKAAEDGEDMGGGLEMAARDLIDAVKNGDVKGTAAALRAAHEICDAERGEDEEDEEEME